jgi:plastocyanin
LRNDAIQPPHRGKYFWTFCILAMIATLVLVGCGGTTTTSTPTATATPTPSPTPLPATIPLGSVIVHMVEKPAGHYIFQPASVTVKAGTVVVWINDSDGMHTITSDPGAPSVFNTTSNVTQGNTFALVFNTPGTYNYHCAIHPTTMKAVITVTA